MDGASDGREPAAKRPRVDCGCCGEAGGVGGGCDAYVDAAALRARVGELEARVATLSRENEALRRAAGAGRAALSSQPSAAPEAAAPAAAAACSEPASGGSGGGCCPLDSLPDDVLERIVGFVECSAAFEESRLWSVDRRFRRLLAAPGAVRWERLEPDPARGQALALRMAARAEEGRVGWVRGLAIDGAPLWVVSRLLRAVVRPGMEALELRSTPLGSEALLDTLAVAGPSLTSLCLSYGIYQHQPDTESLACRFPFLRTLALGEKGLGAPAYLLASRLPRLESFVPMDIGPVREAGTLALLCGGPTPPPAAGSLRCLGRPDGRVQALRLERAAAARLVRLEEVAMQVRSRVVEVTGAEFASLPHLPALRVLDLDIAVDDGAGRGGVRLIRGLTEAVAACKLLRELRLTLSSTCLGGLDWSALADLFRGAGPSLATLVLEEGEGGRGPTAEAAAALAACPRLRTLRLGLRRAALVALEPLAALPAGGDRDFGLHVRTATPPGPLADSASSRAALARLRACLPHFSVSVRYALQ